MSYIKRPLSCGNHRWSAVDALTGNEPIQVNLNVAGLAEQNQDVYRTAARQELKHDDFDPSFARATGNKSRATIDVESKSGLIRHLGSRCCHVAYRSQSLSWLIMPSRTSSTAGVQKSVVSSSGCCWPIV